MKKTTLAVWIIALGAITACTFYALHKKEAVADHSQVQITAPAVVAENTRHPYEATFTALSVPEELKQHFRLNAEASQVVVGESGTMISIPDHAFADKNGNIVKGKVKMEVVEGIGQEDILKMNLGTMSDQGILETGGMVYVNATAENGDTLSIAKGKQLDVEIPVHKQRSGMQLWEGVVQKDGSVLWKNPSPLKEGLHAVPLASLNEDQHDQGGSKPAAKAPKFEASDDQFVQLASTAGWGYTYMGNGGDVNRATLIHAYKINLTSRDTLYVWKQGMANVDSVVKVIQQYRLSGYDWGDFALTSSALRDSNNVLINGGNGTSQIFNLADERFKNTTISTAEFRARIPYINQACDPKIMNCYTDHPSRSLWESDEAAAKELDMINCPLASVFHEFAKMKMEKIDPSDEHTSAALDAARQQAMLNYSKRVRKESQLFSSGSYGTYSFGIHQLGWANVDRLCSNAGVQPSVLNARVNGNNNDEALSVSLLIPDQDIFIPGYKRPNGDYAFTHGEYESTALYPKGTTGYILAKTKGDKLRFCIRKFIFGENTIEELTLREGTENDLSLALGNGTLNETDDNTIIDDWYTRSIKDGWGCLCSGSANK